MMSEKDAKEIVALKLAAEKAYELLDAKVKEVFAKVGEDIVAYQETRADDDKTWTRIQLIDNVKKLKEEGAVFHSTGFKSVAIKVDRLKNQPK